jgi:hypothetical protein
MPHELIVAKRNMLYDRKQQIRGSYTLAPVRQTEA